MELGLENRIAVVTGASRGIARATAHGLSAEGCEVIVGSRDLEALARTADEISGASGNPVHALALDLTDAASIESFVGRVGELVPRVDVLVNSVGGPGYTPRRRLTDGDWQEAFDRLFMSARRVTESLVPGMERQRWGRVVFVLSVTLRQPGMMLANAPHGALALYSKALANELAPRGVTVNGVCPTFVAGERLRRITEQFARHSGSTPDEVMAEWMRGVPLGRPARPEEVADLIVFLASERAGYLTGRCFDVDGGFVRGVL